MKIILATSTLIRWAAVLAMVVACCTVTHAQSALSAEKLSDGALQQISALLQEKATRTPAQTKMDSQLVYAAKRHRNELIAANVPNLQVGVKSQPDGRILVDLNAKVNKELLAQIELVGGKVIDSFPQYNAIRALLPVDQIEGLAGRPDVQFIRQAAEARTNAGSVDSEGDTTHRAIGARSTFGVDGTGVNIGVLSDSADCLTNSINTGDLPATVTVLLGQWGSGYGEGTAMMEIIHDLAPGAGLFFATAFNSEASFAANISNLWVAGCNIIVDDVGYYDEPPFQDGIIAQSVNFVTSHGALYFSSAANSGNKTDGTSGTWEGDFSSGGAVGFPEGGTIHNFGGGTNYDVITSSGSSGYIFLFWSDPFNTANTTNDYDLFILDSTGSSVLYSSTMRQTGAAPAYEYIFYSSSVVNDRLVVVKFSGADRFLHVDTNRGRLQINTSGNTHGHNAAATAFCVAATPAAAAYGPPTPAGPYPNPFNTANGVESFSSDGPRRIFYNPDGSAITPGNFLSTGGLLLQKPNITAADGVTTTVSCKGEPFAPFYGTSAAAPHAAAIAGLLRSYRPSLTTNQLWAALTNSASTLDIMAAGVDRDSGSGIVMADLVLQSVTTSGPFLIAAGSLLSGGNGNGLVDPNECNLLNLLVQNVGGSNATTVSATLTTSTPGATITQGTSTYPTVLPGGVATNAVPFSISTSPSFTCGTPVVVTLAVTYAGGSNTLTYTLPASSGSYTLTQTTGASIVPGSTDTGNHADDGTTTIALPFGYTFYGQTFSNATLDSNGNLQFLSSSSQYHNGCLPQSILNYAIMPLWGDLRTDGVGGGIFTSTSGVAPNRIFNIEWRALYYGTTTTNNFEVRLYEHQSRLDIIYGTLNGNGSSATVGIQKDTGSVFSQFECNSGSLSSGLMLTYQITSCTDGGGVCSALTPFQITSIVASNNNILINWTTGIGQTNALQATAGTGNGSYATNNFADIFAVTNTVTTSTNYADVGAATNIPSRFYRVRLIP